MNQQHSQRAIYDVAARRLFPVYPGLRREALVVEMCLVGGPLDGNTLLISPACSVALPRRVSYLGVGFGGAACWHVYETSRPIAWYQMVRNGTFRVDYTFCGNEDG